jgi:hypothetical protein
MTVNLGPDSYRDWFAPIAIGAGEGAEAGGNWIVSLEC